MKIGPLEIMLIISTLLEFNPLFQTVKIVKLKQAADVSLWTYVTILTVGILWLLYGIQLQSLPMIIGNAIKLFASLTVVIVYFIYKNSRSKITQ
ncbi:MAG: SemiSWEET family transporter [Patescibacteria group bacterium]